MTATTLLDDVSRMARAGSHSDSKLFVTSSPQEWIATTSACGSRIRPPANRTTTRRRAVQFHYRLRTEAEVSEAEHLAVFGSEGKGVTC